MAVPGVPLRLVARMGPDHVASEAAAGAPFELDAPSSGAAAANRGYAIDTVLAKATESTARVTPAKSARGRGRGCSQRLMPLLVDTLSGFLEVYYSKLSLRVVKPGRQTGFWCSRDRRADQASISPVDVAGRAGFAIKAVGTIGCRRAIPPSAV